MYALELRSDANELWARVIGDYFEISRLVMNVMNSENFNADRWTLELYSSSLYETEPIGSFDVVLD